MEHGVCLRMQHQREGAVLHMCTDPQTHFMTITSRETSYHAHNAAHA